MAPGASHRMPAPPPPLGEELTASPSTSPSHPRMPLKPHLLTLCLPVTFLFLVEFQSSSRNTSLRARLGSSVTLDCHFALAPSSTLSSLEWRRQHRGSGRRLFWYEVESIGSATQPKVHVDVAELLGSGNASLSLQEVSVGDEGTYICLVSTPLHKVQHNIHLQVAGEEGKCLGATGVPCPQALKLCPAPLTHCSQHSSSQAACLLPLVHGNFCTLLTVSQLPVYLLQSLQEFV